MEERGTKPPTDGRLDTITHGVCEAASNPRECTYGSAAAAAVTAAAVTAAAVTPAAVTAAATAAAAIAAAAAATISTIAGTVTEDCIVGGAGGTRC